MYENETLGQRIRRLRTDKKMTQEELGNFIGISRGAINKIEKDVTENLKRSQIEILADKLDVTPTYLMGWDNIQSLGRINRVQEDIINDDDNSFDDMVGVVKTNSRTKDLYERRLKQYLENLMTKVEEEVSSSNDIYNIIQKLLKADKLYYSTFELDSETTNDVKTQLKILSSYIQYKIEKEK